MRIYTKTLKNITFPFLILIFVIVMLQNPPGYGERINGVDTMAMIASDGIVEEGRYFNSKLGFSVIMPPSKAGEWIVSEFDAMDYYEHEIRGFTSFEYDLIKLENDHNSDIIIVRVEYINSRKVRKNTQTSEEYSSKKWVNI